MPVNSISLLHLHPHPLKKKNKLNLLHFLEEEVIEIMSTKVNQKL